MIAAQFHDVTKRYGNHVALDHLTMGVPQGSIFGLVGPNGAGKSTAVRILLGLIRSTSGTVSLFEGDPKGKVSYLPDVPGFYSWMTAREHMEFHAGIHQVPRTEQKRRIDALLDMAALASTRSSVGGFSRGMKQRLGIAQALVTSPDLLILDEPTSALDPIGRRDVLDLMANLRGRTTVLFSSHILGDVERVADHFAVLHKAQLIATGSLEDIRAAAGIAPHLSIEILGDTTAFADVVRQRPWLTELSRQGNELGLVVSDTDRAMHELPRIATELGCGIARLENVEPSLDDAFVTLTRGAA